MKKILLILVGGTICTELNEQGNLSVSERAGAMLTAHFENSDSPYAQKVQIDQSKNLHILSENMTVERWNLILDT
ncbi:MAG: asparaginase, partial [Clostridia bacterium]|nr:asparaginase [Clostridia bacterium]